MNFFILDTMQFYSIHELSSLDFRIYFSLKRFGKNATYGYKRAPKCLWSWARCFKFNRSYNMTKLIRFLKDDSGATAIEYGLLAALIAVALIASVRFLGSTLADKFSAIATAID